MYDEGYNSRASRRNDGDHYKEHDGGRCRPCEKAKDNKSPWRFDCEVDSLKNYLFQKVIGANEKDDLFSKNIRWGLMTREEAMNRIEECEVNIDIVERVLSKVNMKLPDLRGIVKS